MNRRAAVLAFTLALLAMTARAAGVTPDDPVWSALQRGTHVVLIRHAQTEPGVGDPPGFKLGDCGTQRNLSDEGRAQARKLGDIFRTRRIEVDRVLSSPWCRCIETARLAFGRAPVTTDALASFFDEPDKREPQVAALRKLVADFRGPGNLVLVTHGNNIRGLTGIAPSMGAIVVLKPTANGGFAVVGEAVVP